jgi:hypothetical protein
MLRALRTTAKESAASALVRAHFRDLWIGHTALLATSAELPVMILADNACDFGREVCAVNGVTEPVTPCVFPSTEAKMLDALAQSSPETIATMRRALAALPPASETCMRIVVFTGGDMIVLHYLHTPETAAAAA